MQMIYEVTFKSGLQRTVSREEEPGKSVIGLWKWSMNQKNPIIIDFTETAILSSEIAAVDRGYPVEDTVREEDRADVEAREAAEHTLTAAQAEEAFISGDVSAFFKGG
jgi:hypothetical protein